MMCRRMCRSIRLPRRLRDGFTLVDVLIGMVIIAIAFQAAFALAVTTSRVVSQNQSLSAATSLAGSKLEELRNEDYADVVTGSDPGTLDAQGQPDGMFTRSWAVQNNAPVADLKTVVVSVSWTQWGQTRTYTLTGVIGQ